MEGGNGGTVKSLSDTHFITWMCRQIWNCPPEKNDNRIMYKFQVRKPPRGWIDYDSSYIVELPSPQWEGVGWFNSSWQPTAFQPWSWCMPISFFTQTKVFYLPSHCIQTKTNCNHSEVRSANVLFCSSDFKMGFGRHLQLMSPCCNVSNPTQSHSHLVKFSSLVTALSFRCLTDPPSVTLPSSS